MGVLYKSDRFMQERKNYQNLTLFQIKVRLHLRKEKSQKLG